MKHTKNIFISFIYILLISCSSNPRIKDPLNNSAPIKNVLFISFCSVNTHFLPTYSTNIEEKNYPNLSAFFNSSFNFINAFNDVSWSNAKRFIFFKEWSKLYGINNRRVEPIQDWKEDGINISYIHIPAHKDLKNQYNDYFDDRRLEVTSKNFDTIINEVTKRNQNPDSKNIWMLHFKLMHYPYLSETYLNNPEFLYSNFTTKELSLINEYIEHPEKYPEKLSFFQVVFGKDNFKNLFIKNNQFRNYATDLRSVERWRKSKNYETDYSILKKSYKLRLKDLDKLVGKIREYYSQHLEKDTALIIGGDHGESLYEHNYLSHGTIPYDEAIHFFYSVHFPHQSIKSIINNQYGQRSLTKIIESIPLGNTNQKNFLSSLHANREDENIISFSCTGDIASIRYDNTWKLIYYLKEEKYQLFNLKNDPDEKIDLADNQEQLVTELKIKILEKISFLYTSPGECVWPLILWK